MVGAIARKAMWSAKSSAAWEPRPWAVSSAIPWTDKVTLFATDEKEDYRYVDQRMRHEAVKDSAGEYVRGEVHTNNIESFWSLIKRGVVGTYHHVSKIICRSI